MRPVHFALEIANTEIGLNPNNSVIKRLCCIKKTGICSSKKNSCKAITRECFRSNAVI